ncbi:sigma factor G inhibitor Gin [Hathewaya histolytica]|uniref:Inhibitor of sigma-G Gin n=1 Tax=Hathewaya histolytica TaxID=1498 RepID=A0A4U9QUY7_HATHI|nr:sigma factor G inhibitor Gin [Hathewaya histolytica]VTQ82476.1 Inhibitor of sigma-G Gin [Hathewaya histolytica]
MKKKSCIICRKPLNDGIMIKGRRICSDCEARLIKEDINTDFYEYFKDRIKRSITRYTIKGVEKEC